MYLQSAFYFRGYVNNEWKMVIAVNLQVHFGGGRLVSSHAGAFSQRMRDKLEKK